MAGNANSGRKKTSIECDKYLKLQCKASLNAIVEIRDNVNAPVSARLDAAKYLCDRYLGKPSQPISGEIGVYKGTKELTDEELSDIARRRSGGAAGASQSSPEPS